MSEVVQDHNPWPTDEENNDNSYNVPENEEETVETYVLGNDNSNVLESTRRVNMENLFGAYSNDDNRYSGLKTEKLYRKLFFIERCGQADIS